MMMSDSWEIALAISTICCWETLSIPTMSVGLRDRFMLSISSCARAFIVRMSSTTPCTGRPDAKMFSATVSSGMRFSSW